VVDGDSNKDDIIQDFAQENMNNYKAERKYFMSNVRPQGAAKRQQKL
jgi:hypothetical protein